MSAIDQLPDEQYEAIYREFIEDLLVDAEDDLVRAWLEKLLDYCEPNPTQRP